MKRRCFLLACAGLFLGQSAGVTQRLSPLAERPDWRRLEAFQETITREEFVRLLETVYAPRDAAKGFIEVDADAVRIHTTLVPPQEMQLRFAAPNAGNIPPQTWRRATQLPPAPLEKPLAGVKIALDPGHLGGAWARLEERFFQVAESKPIAEGEMTLRVAELLAPKLRALGAEVSFARSSLEPTTTARPDSLRDAARAELAAQGVAKPREKYDAARDAARGTTVQAQSELLFYRISEIRSRAELVNKTLQPDVILCLHFNAEAWGNPQAPDFVPRNHLHVLVNGCYSAGELRHDDVRFEMLWKLLQRGFAEELAISERVAEALAVGAHLPPYRYTTSNAMRVGSSPYLWARNLLANRLYDAPVVFLEPYVMNSHAIWERVQLGDYEGERLVAGKMRKSLYREYADAVAEGMRDYYARARPGVK